MAKSVDDKGRPIISRSPRQASRIFGLDQDYYMGSPGDSQTSIPRPKFLFVVRFIRGGGQGSAKWKDGLSFAVRSFGRPKISPQVQELNQYNKKRVIHTGVKYGGVNIEFYDTVDAVVSYMWSEYAAYHFGDFRRQDDYDWKYDATNAQFYNSGERGFGFTLPQGTDPLDTESGSFFEKVECYQFFGGSYNQFDLIHPKITSFDPDAMEYEGTTGHGIRMTMDYEAVIYHNNFVPAPIRGNRELSELYGNQLDGDVYEPPAAYPRSIFQSTGSILQAIGSLPNSIGRIIGNESLAGMQVIPDKVTSAVGVLGSFGTFDFQGGISQILAPVTGAVGTIVGSPPNQTLSGPTTIKTNNPLNASNYDVAIGAAQKALGGELARNKDLVSAYVANTVTGTPIITALNANRDSSSQIGVRTTKREDPPPA